MQEQRSSHPIDYTQVTELSGTRVSSDQIGRIVGRYRFASTYCKDKDVIELACGPGQGLGYLAAVARRVVGGDIDDGVLAQARAHYRNRDKVEVLKLDAQSVPFGDATFDVVILYEAIYYLPSPERFAAEAKRLLRPGGVLLLCTANKDLPDFNPSPHSHRYLGPPDFVSLLTPLGFSVECYGEAPLGKSSLKRHALRFAKKSAVRFGLMPKTMRGKELFKRIVFGRLVEMPYEIRDNLAEVPAPTQIRNDLPDREHRVIHCVARLPLS